MSELFEMATEILKAWISQNKDADPAECSIRGHDGKIYLNYAPGETVELTARAIIDTSITGSYLEEKLSNRHFAPVWSAGTWGTLIER